MSRLLVQKASGELEIWQWSLTDFLQSKLQLPEDTTLEQADARAQLRLGLFSYPVLQAADILVHRYDSPSM